MLVDVPLFHGMEATSKYRKAKAEATLYESKLQEARELITLQVTQQRKQLDESRESLARPRPTWKRPRRTCAPQPSASRPAS